MRTSARHVASAAVVIALGFTALAERGAQAHKAVTSKYTYNQDVFPILRDRCGRCHDEGGPAPMSLLTYKNTWPWAESIRQELTSERMPPWYVDPLGPSIKGDAPMSARQIDVILTWATGGSPEGDPDKKPAALASPSGWRYGEPDLKLEMERDHTVAADLLEETSDFSFRPTIAQTKWVRAADLLPGTPSMVRDALISVENGPVLAAWLPGGDLIAAPAGTAFKLPAGATIHLKIRYKKPWQDERIALSDRSTIGLYFTEPPALGRGIEAVDIVAPEGTTADASKSRVLSGAWPNAGRIVAIRPSLDRPYGSVNVRAVTPSGDSVPLLRLRAPQPEWRRRYWLVEPVDLLPGSRIEVALTPADIGQNDARPTQAYPLQIALDYAPPGR